MGTSRHGDRRRRVRPVVGSAGRPGVLREVQQRFWKEIAEGVPSERAAAVAGVALAVGVRWFRRSGGVPNISLATPSNRFLSFPEREEIALLRAQGCGRVAATSCAWTKRSSPTVWLKK